MNEIVLSNDLNQIELEIKHHKSIAGQSIFEIGRRLKHVKENNLLHGEWENWCIETIEITPAYANRYIRVFEEFENSNQYTSIGLNKLYQIATLPEEERGKEHILESGERKPVDDMTVRELQEVKRKLRNKEAQLKQAQRSEQVAIQKLEDAENKEPKVIREPYIPDDYQKLEETEKQLRSENRRLSEETNQLKERLEKIESDSNEVERLERTIKQLDQQKSQIGNILDANDRLSELEKEFHTFFDKNMSPLKYKPLVNELYEFNGTERMKELVNLARAWVDDMDRMLPNGNRKIIEGEIINE